MPAPIMFLLYKRMKNPMFPIFYVLSFIWKINARPLFSKRLHCRGKPLKGRSQPSLVRSRRNTFAKPIKLLAEDEQTSHYTLNGEVQEKETLKPLDSRKTLNSKDLRQPEELLKSTQLFESREPLESRNALVNPVQPFSTSTFTKRNSEDVVRRSGFTGIKPPSPIKKHFSSSTASVRCSEKSVSSSSTKSCVRANGVVVCGPISRLIPVAIAAPIRHEIKHKSNGITSADPSTKSSISDVCKRRQVPIGAGVFKNRVSRIPVRIPHVRIPVTIPPVRIPPAAPSNTTSLSSTKHCSDKSRIPIPLSHNSVHLHRQHSSQKITQTSGGVS